MVSEKEEKIKKIKIYFQTHGCSNNISESEIMMGLLPKPIFKIVEEPKKADILIINICTVKGEEKALSEIRKLYKHFPNKKLIVGGCITCKILIEARRIKKDVSFISTHNIKLIADVIKKVLKDKIIETTSFNKYEKINLPKIRKNPIIGIIPILNGCINHCSYCSLKSIKGKLYSYEIKSIKKEAIKCLEDGCKELWITSQDNAAYMLDRDKISKLPELINRIAGLNKNFLIRVGMMNPSNLLNILYPMIKLYKNDKLFKFLHLPVQSGNNEILRIMKRGYNVEDFKKIVSEFRKNIPNLTISTDIIVGFPTESEQQFNDSLNLIKEIKPDVLNISRFQARPGTEAAKMQHKIDSKTIKGRSVLLTKIFTNIAKMQNKKWLNWTGDILIDERGKQDTWIGRNFAYKQIIIRGNVKLGDIVKVKVVNTTTYDLRGEVILKN